jgi:hypothetical protein
MKLLHPVVKKIPSVLFLGLLVVETSHAEWVDLGTRTYSRLCPEWIGGDREYAGHGPEVTARAQLFTANSDTELYIDIEMHQIETKSDWSEAQLSRPFLIYRAPAGRRITSILNSDVSELFYVDNDHALDRFFPADNLVREFQVMGDTGGNDIGNCTSDDAYLSVFLKPLEVFLQ